MSSNGLFTEVVTPAVHAQRPDLDGRWRVMRSSAPSDGAVTDAFLLEDGNLTEIRTSEWCFPPTMATRRQRG